MAPDQLLVLRGRVALVLLEAILRLLPGVVKHPAVPGGLGKDRGGLNCRHRGIASDDGLAGQGQCREELAVHVDRGGEVLGELRRAGGPETARPALQRRLEGALHGQEAGPVDVQLVDLRRPGPAQPPGVEVPPEEQGECVAARSTEFLGVRQAGYAAVDGEDGTGRRHGAGQGAAAGFIDPTLERHEGNSTAESRRRATTDPDAQEGRMEVRGARTSEETNEPVILQLNDSFRPVMDGVAICAENYAKWLTLDHEQTVVVTPRFPTYHYREVFPVYSFMSLPFLPMRPFRLGLPVLDRDFQRQLDTMQFSIIHSHCPFVTGLMALRLARERGIPHVTTFHSKYHEDFLRVAKSRALVRQMLKFLVAFYDRADAVWAPNTPTARTLRSYGFTGPIDVVPSGTDMSAPDDDEMAHYRREGMTLLRQRVPADFDLSRLEELPVFLFVGQHRWEKNLELIIHSLDALNRRGVEFRAFFVGTGYAADALRRLTQRRGLSDKVSFVGVVVERERIKGLYALSDLFLFPSLYDTVGLVVREAAAFGVPSVLVRGSSATEGIEDGREAFFTENDATGMAALLESLSGDMERVRRVGREARNRLDLSWRTIVGQVHEKYREIIRSHSR